MAFLFRREEAARQCEIENQRAVALLAHSPEQSRRAGVIFGMLVAVLIFGAWLPLDPYFPEGVGQFVRLGGVLLALALILAPFAAARLFGVPGKTLLLVLVLGLTAAAHVHGACGNIVFADLDGYFSHTFDPVVDGMAVKDGMITLPETPQPFFGDAVPSHRDNAGRPWRSDGDTATLGSPPATMCDMMCSARG